MNLVRHNKMMQVQIFFLKTLWSNLIVESKSDISLVVDHVIEGRLSSKENRNENDQEHENSVGNIVTLFDSARNKIKNFARSLSANRSNGSARTNPIQNHCPMSKSSGVPEKFVLLGETDLPQHQAAPVK